MKRSAGRPRETEVTTTLIIVGVAAAGIGLAWLWSQIEKPPEDLYDTEGHGDHQNLDL